MGKVISMYDHQLEALKNMHNGCILCGGVGSGKSRTSLAYYYILNGGMVNTNKYVPMKPNPMDLYIITTARKRDTLEWEGELVPFLMSKDPDHTQYKHKIIVDSWNNIKKYADVRGAFFIFDEQRVVGNGTWVKSFLKIAKSNRWILLSATPGDTWMDYVPVFIANGFYKNRTEFIQEHVVYSRFTKYPKVERYLGVGRLIRLRNKVLVDMEFNRHTVAHHEDITVEYDKKKYDEVTKTRWDPYKDEPIQNAGSLCYVWRKIVNSDTSRQLKLMDIFEEHGRIIVFYNFDYELEILKSIFGKYKEYSTKYDSYKKGGFFDYAEWNGHAHEPIPETDRWAYLVQYTAGCEGWNCITTDTIVFYSQNYSYKVMEQAAGRIDRLNTPFTSLWYYHLKSRSPIDLGIAQALRKKKKFNEGKFVKW